jgi:Conserved hypothetical protein 2217 (DUF2460)
MIQYITDSSTQVWAIGVTNTGSYTTTAVSGPTGPTSILMIDVVTSAIWSMTISTAGTLQITSSSGTGQTYIFAYAPDGALYGIEVNDGAIATDLLAPGGSDVALLTFPLTFGGNIGMPIKQTPIFNTITQTPASGRGEVRIPTMEFPRYDFVLDVSYLTGDAQGTYKGQVISGGTQWQQLINFYLAVQGSANNWLFLHPYDNSVGSYTIAGSHTGTKSFVVGEVLIQTSTLATANFISLSGTLFTISGYSGATTPDNTHTWVGQTSGAVWTPSGYPVLASSMAFATGDGVTTAFSIIRSYITGGAQDLIQNFVGSLETYGPLIYVGGVLQSSANYNIDIYGTITFNTAPAANAVISWTGMFFYCCSFEEDKFDDLSEDFYQIWTLSGLKFRSVLQ